MSSSSQLAEPLRVQVEVRRHKDNSFSQESAAIAEYLHAWPFANTPVQSHTEVLAQVRAHLDQMLQSRMFIRSERLGCFLRFVVEHALLGQESRLKEYVIGSEVYDRKPPYDPSQDSIVRTEARRLRSKLKAYYEREGAADTLRISMQPGSYVPTFRARHTPALECHRVEEKPFPAYSVEAPVVLAILPFTDLCDTPRSSAYARILADELAFAIGESRRYRLVSSYALALICSVEHDFPALMERVGARIALGGSVRLENDRAYITTNLIDATGLQLWIGKVDACAHAETLHLEVLKSCCDGFRAVLASPLDCAGCE